MVRAEQGKAVAPASGVGLRSAPDLDAAPLPIVRLDADGRLLGVNPAWWQWVMPDGAGAGISAGSPYLAMLAEIDADLAQGTARVLERLSAEPGSKAAEELHRVRGRALRWYRVEALRLEYSVVLSHIDSTEQRRAEAHLRLASIASAALAGHTPLVTACRDLAAGVCESLGWSFACVWLPNEWQQLVCAELLVDASLAQTELESLARTARFERGHGLPGCVWERGCPLWSSEAGADARDPLLERGRALGLQGGFAVPMHHAGQVFAVIEVLGRTDRSEERCTLELLGTIGGQLGAYEHRGRAQVRGEALGVGRSQLEELIENAPGYIVAIDEQRRIRFVNRVQSHVRREDVIGSDWLRFVPPAQHAALLPKLSAVMTHGVPQRYDLGILGPDGREVWLSVHMAPLRERGAITGAIITALDTTELKRAQMEFAAAQRWISVGTLAAGLAHEINTPVQFVCDNLQFIGDAARRLSTLTDKLAALPSQIAATTADRALVEAGAQAERAVLSARLPYLQQELPRAIEACVEGLSRVSTIVRSLEDFAQPASADMEPADLNGLVRRALAMAAAEYGAVAELDSEWGELPPVCCRGGDISQVVLNVILNAVDAIRDVVASTHGKGRLGVRTWREHDQAVIAIEDSGGGIPEAIRARVFDPFFTTKGVGKGTGQGLALAWSVIKQQHGGVITFESVAGKGTTFYIRLPIAGRSDENGR